MEKRQRYIPAFYYHWLDSVYDPILRYLGREGKFKRRLMQQASRDKGQRVLDIGCGTATLTILVKQACPECEVTGLDGDPHILEIARRKITRADLNIALLRGTAASLPFPDNYFDRVFTSLVLHHLSRGDRTSAFKEIRRVLKPGGELHIAELGKSHNPTMWVISRFIGPLEAAKDFVRGLLPKMLDEAGFDQTTETYRLSTMFGTISLYRARKPA